MSTGRNDTDRQMPGYFNKAQVRQINGGNFVYNNLPNDPNKYLDLLYKKVAVNAILNAGGRADPVHCFPGTREEVLARIHRWRTEGYHSDRRPFWLSGPAGAGKSAIIQTVAEYCLEHGILMANFFFFRTDQTRNCSNPLAATVAYQLLDFDPSLKHLVHSIIQNDPLVIKKSIQDQFSALVDIPVRQSTSLMQRESPIILLIDGLDECEPKEDQVVILDVLYNLVTAPNSPFIALVASRTEHQITKTFNRLGSFSNSIFLDNTFRPDDDIRRYLEAQFLDIKCTHTLRQFIPPVWPSDDAITHLVGKSSGQFIYAATVVRFISDSPASPKESLREVISLTSMSTNTPFAPLDALYMHILSQSKERDLSSVLEVLAVYIMATSASATQFGGLQLELPVWLKHLGYPAGAVVSLISGILSLVKIVAHAGGDANDGIIFTFHHTSFSDFLIDEGRSGVYHPDFTAIASRIFLSRMTASEHNAPDSSAQIFIKWIKNYNPYLDAALRTQSLVSTYFFSNRVTACQFLDHLNVVYQEHHPHFHQFIFERWAVIWITRGEDIGHHWNRLSCRTLLDLQIQRSLNRLDGKRWEWYALRAVDRRYRHL